MLARCCALSAKNVKSLALDDIVKICTDFYTEAEIIDARGLIDSISADIRLPRRKSQDRLRQTVEDIVKFILNPTKAEC